MRTRWVGQHQTKFHSSWSNSRVKMASSVSKATRVSSGEGDIWKDTETSVASQICTCYFVRVDLRTIVFPPTSFPSFFSPFHLSPESLPPSQIPTPSTSGSNYLQQSFTLCQHFLFPPYHKDLLFMACL